MPSQNRPCTRSDERQAVRLAPLTAELVSDPASRTSLLADPERWYRAHGLDEADRLALAGLLRARAGTLPSEHQRSVLATGYAILSRGTQRDAAPRVSASSDRDDTPSLP